MAFDRAIVGKLIVWALVIVGVAFAVQGGEYSTLDLLRQKREIGKATSSIDSLRHAIDSLKQYDDKVENDPATQERIAREEFGMVRDKELLYRFAETADSARSKPQR